MALNNLIVLGLKPYKKKIKSSKIISFSVNDDDTDDTDDTDDEYKEDDEEITEEMIYKRISSYLYCLNSSKIKKINQQKLDEYNITWDDKNQKYIRQIQIKRTKLNLKANNYIYYLNTGKIKKINQSKLDEFNIIFNEETKKYMKAVSFSNDEQITKEPSCSGNTT